MELTVTNRSKAYPQEEQVFQYEILKVYKTLNGLVAQLVRAPPCHGGGHGFESRLGRLSVMIIVRVYADASHRHPALTLG